MSIFDKFFSRISLRRSESRAISEQRGIGRDNAKQLKTEETITGDVASGKTSGLIKGENYRTKIIKDKAERSQRILIDCENVIRKELLLITTTIETIKRSNLAAKEKALLIRHIKEKEFDPFKKEFELILGQEGGIESTNLSLYKALDNASLHRDALFKLRQVRKDVRKVKRDGKTVLKMTRKTTVNLNVQNLVKDLDEDEVQEINDMNAALHDEIISLQRDIEDLAKTITFLNNLVAKEGFPSTMAAEELKKLDDTKKSIIDGLKKEQESMTRLFISEAERLNIEVTSIERATDRDAA